MTTDTVYASPRLRATFVPAGDDSRIVVTFHGWSKMPALEGPGFGEGFLLRRGIAALHVRCATNAWYQYEEMPDLAAAVAPILGRYREVVTYGESMGGYAALRFIDLFGATRCLASGPQYSIDRAVVPFETRWWREAAATRFLDHRLTNHAGADVVLLYDPYAGDARHADLIAQDIHVRRVRVPYADHPVTGTLKQAGLLSETISAILAGTFDEATFARAYRREKWRSAVVLRSLARIGRWLPRRVALLRASVAKDPNDHQCRHDLAIALLKLGGAHLPEAEQAARDAVALFPDMAPYYRTLATVLHRRGATAAGKEALEEGFRHGAADDAAYRFHATFAGLLDRPDQAEASLRKAIALAPRAHASHAALAALLDRSGRGEEALDYARQALALAPHGAGYRAVVEKLQDAQGTLAP